MIIEENIPYTADEIKAMAKTCEKYNKALERARGLLEGIDKGDYFASNEDIENIFPELKDEDERIKKDIISYLRNEKIVKRYISDIEVDKWIDWLEKQGEQKPTENVEIKFCEGDKVVSNQNGKVYTVGTAYYVTGNNICLHDTDGNHLWTNRDDLNKNYHLWTIKDAKDGDVLNSPSHRLIWIYKDNEHYHVGVNMNYATKNIATDGLIKIPSDACPATIDVRTILFEKTKEAGYEWDSEKKELKKIEPKSLNADNKIKELFNKSSQNYYKAIGEVREIASAYLKKIVRSKGGKIIDNDDDELLDSIAIAYDGGNHPEYASSAVCPLLSIVLNDKDELEFNVEDEEGLDLSRITTEDLVYITDTFSKLI